MKHILGLDLGTNSIGWALIEIDHDRGVVKVLGLGSRILPMDAGEIKDFESNGKIKSTAAQRTEKRGPRRLNERYLLRRDRLHLVLDLLNALPKHYKLEIDFKNKKGEKCGQFKKNAEPKMAYLPKQKGEKAEFLFKVSYQEMLDEIGIENKKKSRIPYDWTLYYLRQKALSKEITLEELAWVLLSYNQKRGYEKNEIEDKSTKEGEIVEELDLRVKEVISKADKDGKQYYEVHLDGNDNFVYNEYSDVQMTFKDDLKEIVKMSKVDEQGNIEDKKTEFRVVDIYPLEIKDVHYEKDDGKHKYTLTYQNGWKETKPPKKNYTFQYKNALNKSYDYIVETVYDNQGKLKTQQGKERKLREPDLSDNSSDWTLLKKKTEKDALAFNYDNGYIDSKTKEPKKYISTKIYNVLKNDAKTGDRTKIIGGMFQVVDRDFYREELKQIITTQRKFHKNLEDKKVFEQCVNTLYPKNKSHQESLLKNKNAIQHLLVEDVLLYQRPLKSKKSEIANCKYEIGYWRNVEDKNGNPIEEVDLETGELKTKKEAVYIKVVSASHPYFQEFRIWDKLHNLRLIQLEKEVDGKKLTNKDVTKEYFKTEKDYQELFDELNNRKSLSQDQFLAYCKKKFKIDYKPKDSNYAWNFPEDEEIKGNETRVSFATRFKRCGFTKYADFLSQEKERELWHYLYSVSFKERTANDNKSAVTFFNNYFDGLGIDDEVKEKIIKDFVNYPKFTSRYCAYSEKSLKKLLPLIRLNEPKEIDQWSTEQWYVKWKENLAVREEEILLKLKEIDFNVENIDYDKVIITNVDLQNGELPFPKGLFNTFKSFEKLEDFKNLNLTQASYLVYGRHSELAQAKYWTSPDDIRKQLHQELKQHSLNNPVAEKVLLEMMQVVADIWDYYGNGEKDFFSKIHLEVGRELKKSAKEKESESKRMSGSRSQNKRIRQVLEEYLAQNPYNANPKNSDHFERLKIVEEGAEHTKNTDKDFFKDKSYSKKDIEDILKKPNITKADFEKYKLWIEQGYRSPYSGQMIKITELFDGAKYNIDHIFPQASITNNSLSNKVVVEVALNKLKSDKTARAFIQSQNGQPYLGIPVCTEDEFVNIVKTQFSGTKRYILLSKDIPKGFTDSQMNNARHIARKAMELLSHIVREPGEVEFRSKNVLPVTGMVTTELKRAWKFDQVWRELVSPRFIRLNELTQSNLFGDWQISKNGQKYFDCNIDDSIREKDESYDIKRIDHRHHALDALIVALCTEDHVHYLSNINADKKLENFGKQKKLENYRLKLKQKIMWSKPKKEKPKESDWYFMKPGEKRQDNYKNSREDSVLEMAYHYKDFEPFHSNYKKMVLTALQNTIVTFKQNLRVINKTVNRYNKTPNKNKFEKQNTDNGQKQNWSIRRSLGKGTFYSKIDVGKRENKQLITNAEFFYHNIDAIVNSELRSQIREIKKTSNSEDMFKKNLKEKFSNIRIECIDYKIASRFNSELNTTFNREKIKSISDTAGRTKAILLNQLKQFDTIELPFEEAVIYIDFILEKQEFEAIANDSETEFQSIDDFITHLRANNYKYKKTDYSKLNVFIEKLTERDFRTEKRFEDKIQDHPEIAFTPEAIEEMNKLENIRKLNDGKNHKPIRKVTTYTGFGKQRAVSGDKESVKSKQYVVNDAGTNIYLSVYELEDKSKISRKNPIRIFKEINLFDLIDYQKSTDTNGLPIDKSIYSDDGEEYNLLFTLTQNDIVKINNENGEFIYAFNRFSGNDIYFRPINHSTEIDKYEVDLKPINPKTGKNSGSQTNETTSFNGEQIKNICNKLNVDRLGNISKVPK
ncbi:type II CRISPR RNA-guided endonuclease Cas9 [Xanthomarina gelatinilytica]|uniref:type II CRISPR RNA-guided endonuclease Cas9 n=1 Tax=Xanthomarina gelatinilytica TaxID=1137281 RepID=UPI003AA7D620